MQNNILLQANEIVYSRSEEKTRQYGDFIESMTRMSAILASRLWLRRFNASTLTAICVILRATKFLSCRTYRIVVQRMLHLNQQPV